jgi:prephenate dehydrogenase
LSKIFKKTLVIGLGLIGGSFAKALNKNNLSSEIFAFDTDQDSIDLAVNDGVIIEGTTNLNMFEHVFDFVVIAAPLSAYEEIFDKIGDVISPQTLIIDLGSLKDFIDEILPKKLANNFIACHPIAGSEKSGFENSDAELFTDKRFVICSSEKTNLEFLEIIKNIAERIGSKAELLEAKKHDEIYALTSHLPQFLSFLTREFSPKEFDDEFFKTAFRLDDSNPEIWEEIFELNDKNMEKFYIQFFDNLEKEMQNFLSLKTENSEFTLDQKSQKLLEENFAAIFARAIFVKSYLNIPQVESYRNYAGSGFRDFTSIIKILNLDDKFLSEMIEKNHKKITKIFNSLS